MILTAVPIRALKAYILILIFLARTAVKEFFPK